MTSDDKAARIECGIRLIKRVQESYSILIDDDSLPYQAAAAIVSDGPYDGLFNEIQFRMDELSEAYNTLESLANSVRFYESGGKLNQSLLTNGE